MTKGIIIEFEGLDCSFKETNTKRLEEYLSEKLNNRKCIRIEYPQYLSESSYFIRQYLAGNYGKDPALVKPEIGIMIYALDRYNHWMKDIKQLYDMGYIIITDRYTISNMVYQGAKAHGGNLTHKAYFKKVYDLEHDVLGLPKPNIVIFMDQPLDIAIELMEEKETSDINEKNNRYMESVYNTFYDIVEEISQGGIYYNCKSIVIKCGENGLPRGKNEIFEDIKSFIDTNEILFK